MAAKRQIDSLNEEVTCRICHAFFIDPVILGCGHNFCRRCITRRWERETRNACPECNAVFADRTLKVNQVLGSLAQKAQDLTLTLKQKERKIQCEEHQEELKLFCETDKKLICVICSAAREHREHRYMPVNEAIDILKSHVQSTLESMEKKKSDIQEMADQQKQKISGVRDMSQSLEAYVKSLFADLRQILTEREQRLLGELRVEAEKVLNPMESNLRKIKENLSSLQNQLSTLQQQMVQQDNVALLKEEYSRKGRINEEERTFSILDGTLPDKQFSHASLLKEVLSGEFNFFRQVSVKLDVETAASRLEVSDDLRCVRWTRMPRNVPVNSKRFENQVCVLGSEGFTAGRHYWDVDVTANRRWTLGVAVESVSRKGLVRHRPATGVWSITRKDDKLYAKSTGLIQLPVDQIPGRVRVYLSYESGSISFCGMDNSHLYTFTGKFDGKLYPFFGTVDGSWMRT